MTFSLKNVDIKGSVKEKNYIFELPHQEEKIVGMYVLYDGDFERLSVDCDNHSLFEYYREILLFHSATQELTSPQIIQIDKCHKDFLNTINTISDFEIVLHNFSFASEEHPRLIVTYRKDESK